MRFYSVFSKINFEEYVYVNTYVCRMHKYCISHIYLPPAYICQAAGKLIALEYTEVKTKGFLYVANNDLKAAK